ncbi:MAG TPA: TMEM175 family protein [Acidobacteriaceae bacterium]|jgi:uncharacterized membrane protein|nr:TMEM175 family protein [Acidobacteriaceae bacterium]
MAALYNAIQGRSLERLAALSDGIFAVAMTLLVLDIHIPPAEGIHSEAELLHALAAMAPQWMAYLMSFLTLGIFWAGQQTQLNHMREGCRDLTWIHLAFLFCITLMPLTTRLLAEFITYRTALVLYWLNILLPGAMLYWSWTYVTHHGLIKDETSAEVHGAICRRVLIAQSLYAFGALLCIVSNYLSIGFIVLVQLNYAIAPRFGKRLG